MNCYECHAEIQNGEKFCKKCGAAQMVDEDLINRVLNKDDSAFSTLYKLSYYDVYWSIKSATNVDEDTIQDLIQETFIKVDKYLPQLKNVDAYKGWLKRIAKNVVIDYMRKSKQSKTIFFSDMVDKDSDIDEIEFEDERPYYSPEAVVDYNEKKVQLNGILDTLPEAQRLVVSMYFYQDMSYAEIAEELGISENTVKSRMKYARGKIEKEVNNLKKKGVNLYGLAPIPFFIWLLKGTTAQAAELPSEAVLSAVQAEIGASTASKAVGAGTKAMAGKGAKTAGKAGIKATMTKAIAGVAVVATIGGAGAVIHNRTSAPETIEAHYITDFSEIDDTTLDEILDLVESKYDELLDSGHTIDIKDGEHDFSFWQEDIQTISDTSVADRGYFAYKTDPSGYEENILFVPCYVSVTDATYTDEFGIQQISFEKAIGAYKIRNIYMQEDGNVIYDAEYIDFTGFYSTKELLEEVNFDTIEFEYAYEVLEENFK